MLKVHAQSFVIKALLIKTAPCAKAKAAICQKSRALNEKLSGFRKRRTLMKSRSNSSKPRRSN